MQRSHGFGAIFEGLLRPRPHLVLGRAERRPQHLTEHVGLSLDCQTDLAQMAGLETELEKLSCLDPRREGPARKQLAGGVRDGA